MTPSLTPSHSSRAAGAEAAMPGRSAQAVRRGAMIVIAGMSVACAVAIGRLAATPDRVTIAPHIPHLWLTIHLVCAVPAIPLGGWILLRRKGDRRHKILGRIWGIMMLGAALSSFALTGLLGGSFSPIHALSILTLVTIPRAVWNIRRGNVRAHKRSMMTLYISLVVAAGFAFLPGRLMGEWLMG
ncbi:DUF2306 domain-containing protein [Tsuneonella suprasediminis]|uniref:DUF2306 domain-containing protein n=1 Tax=Tsuneonella suprasediminis TaxID=2306996 RepID=UPI002F92B4EC